MFPRLRTLDSLAHSCHTYVTGGGGKKLLVFCSRNLSSKSGKISEPYILTSHKNGITTICMNRSKRLNAWTGPMMKSIFEELENAANDEKTKAVILTGKGRYYCAGVDLGSTLKPMMPKTLFERIRTMNQHLFDSFINFDKPLIVAVNGNAVGASVTSATLADAIVAVDDVTFSTPFAALGVCPEGCSSVNFPKMMGEDNANRMLGKEAWKPTAKEWQPLLGDIFQGLVAPSTKADENERIQENEENVQALAQKVAEEWVNSGKGKRMDETTREEMRKVNAKESIQLATCFLDYPFLEGQYNFAIQKNKKEVANLFWFLKTFRPLWIKLL